MFFLSTLILAHMKVWDSYSSVMALGAWVTGHGWNSSMGTMGDTNIQSSCENSSSLKEENHFCDL